MSKASLLARLLFLMICCALTVVAPQAVLAQFCCDPLFCEACVDGGGLCDPASCSCQYKTPIIIDISGTGYHLTDAANGVFFRFAPGQSPLPVGWTADSRNAFLALDRNGNGQIDDSSELFGSFTPQPRSAYPNGFRALAEYDKSENGGNGDGLIDASDAIFVRLKLWIDANHDGSSQRGELLPLPALWIFSISLDYQFSSVIDEFGNMFRFRSQVNGGRTRQSAYDVLLTTE